MLFRLLLALALLAPLTAAAEKRVALVVGNDAYDEAPRLAKAANDARSVAAALRAVGFDVIEEIDVTRRNMNRALQTFANRLAPGDVALFFYAGHGIEIGGRNYLLPVDIPAAAPGQEDFVKSEAIAFERVLDRVFATGARLSISILDACRDNPFVAENGRSVGSARGLSRVTAPSGSFIMYSADAGQTALDRLNASDEDPNSVFTRKLLPLMARPGLDLVSMAKAVRSDVNKLARTVNHLQTPAYDDGVLGAFYFVEEPEPTNVSITPPKPEAAPERPGPSSKELDLEFWRAIGPNGSTTEYEAYLEAFPDGTFASLAKARLAKLSTANDAAAAAATTDDLTARINRFKARGGGPTFNCAKASTTDEFAICASPQLSALDRVLNEEFDAVWDVIGPEERKALRARQTNWLNERRTCEVDACIEAAIVRRIRELQAY